jgi:hypothetical protein
MHYYTVLPCSPTKLHENPLTTTSDNLPENPFRRLKYTVRTFYSIQLYKHVFARKTLGDLILEEYKL